MHLLYLISFLLFFSCNIQPGNPLQGTESSQSKQVNIPFEEITQFPYQITAERFLILDSQQKIDDVYASINAKNKGSRMAPIPTYTGEETYLVIKPVLKTTNSVSVDHIFQKGDTLYVAVKPVNDPQQSASSRVAPNVIIKLEQKISAQKVIINYL